MFQNACKEAMELWGYRMAHNATHMASKEFYPIENYTVTEWTIQYVAMEQWFVTWRIKPNSHFVSIVYTIYFWLQFVMCKYIFNSFCNLWKWFYKSGWRSVTGKQRILSDRIFWLVRTHVRVNLQRVGVTIILEMPRIFG